MENLDRRIDAMDWKRPYVWRLRISSSEFAALERAVAAGRTSARQNVVYLAEWYKRCYDGGTAKPVRAFDGKALFEEAGIDLANLFETENGNKMWLYSLYVLGGVAITFECARSNTGFLKDLCRVYYGEGDGVDSLDVSDPSRAVAFRESVCQKGCLYEYLKAMLVGIRSGDLPFAATDLADRRSLVHAFIERLKHANDAVLKSKFDVEWVIGFDPYAPHMTRRLRLALKPESLGGLNHAYLGSERVRQWGITPEACRRIVVGVRFLRDGKTVAEPDFVHPLLDFANTGRIDVGFVAWGTERYSRKIVAPLEPFNQVEVLAQDDQGCEHLVERVEVADWMQVYRLPDQYNEWTTRKVAQRESAVICPASFEILGVGETETVCRKKFAAKGQVTAETFLWMPVRGTVRFRDAAGQECTVYNRQGCDEVVARLHPELLRYRDGCVNYLCEEDDETVESWLPLIFGWEDLRVRHTEARDDGDEVVTETDCERIEFKDGRNFREWTGTEQPEPGRGTVRVTVKGAARPPLEVYYLPSGIRRDCVNGEIEVGGEIVRDKIARDGCPTDPVLRRSVGDDAAFVYLEIWRPLRHKEFVRDGRVVRYAEEGEEVDISYALKDGLVIYDFSESGYREYDCGDIGNVYELTEFHPEGDANLAAITEPAKRRVRVCERLDAGAPSWLWLNLAGDLPVAECARMLYWNYRSDCPPREVGRDFACSGNDLVFQDIRNVEGVCVQAPTIPDANPFAFAGEEMDFDPVDSFEVATRHGVYYFAMQPLREVRDFRTELYEPLTAKRGGVEALAHADQRGLLRLAMEFGFDWGEKYGISIEKE